MASRKVMEEIHDRLVEKFGEMTREEIEAEFEALKEYNEIGVTWDEYVEMLEKKNETLLKKI